MYLACQIYKSPRCCCSHVTINPSNFPFVEYLNEVPHFLQNVPVRNLNNPQTEYHTWLDKTDGKELDRAKIIKYQQSNKKIKTKTNWPIIGQKTSSVEKKKNMITFMPFRSTDVPLLLPNDESDESDSSTIAIPDLLNEKKTPAINILPVCTSETASFEMFQWLANLHWADRDEMTMPDNILRVYDVFKVSSYMMNMIILAKNFLKLIEAKTGALASLSHEQKYNFAFHVIAKGDNFYYNSLIDPDFCLYLLPDQYQPLYSFMKKKIS